MQQSGKYASGMMHWIRSPVYYCVQMPARYWECVNALRALQLESSMPYSSVVVIELIHPAWRRSAISGRAQCLVFQRAYPTDMHMHSPVGNWPVVAHIGAADVAPVSTMEYTLYSTHCLK